MNVMALACSLCRSIGLKRVVMSYSILANSFLQCYLSRMEVLEQLEKQVAHLLDDYKRLKGECVRLCKQLSDIEVEKAVLASENHTLKIALEQEGQLRAEARSRIDALLRKIEEHDSIE